MLRPPHIRFSVGAILIAALLLLPTRASAQFVVDCSGNTPGAYTTINAVIPLLANNGSVTIAGTCTENVALASLSGVSFGASWGSTATLNGNLTIVDSSALTIYGLNVTSPTSAGIVVQHSRDIAFDACSSNGNGGNGLQADNASDVVIGDSGSFSNNAGRGISVTGSSIVALFAWGGPIDVSNNGDSGMYADRSEIDVLGNVTINNNKSVQNAIAASGFGVDFRGAARGFLFSIFGPVTLQGNQAGGASLQENSPAARSSATATPSPSRATAQSASPPASAARSRSTTRSRSPTIPRPALRPTATARPTSMATTASPTMASDSNRLAPAFASTATPRPTSAAVKFPAMADPVSSLSSVPPWTSPASPSPPMSRRRSSATPPPGSPPTSPESLPRARRTPPVASRTPSAFATISTRRCACPTGAAPKPWRCATAS